VESIGITLLSTGCEVCANGESTNTDLYNWVLSLLPFAGIRECYPAIRVSQDTLENI